MTPAQIAAQQVADQMRRAGLDPVIVGDRVYDRSYFARPELPPPVTLPGVINPALEPPARPQGDITGLVAPTYSTPVVGASPTADLTTPLAPLDDYGPQTNDSGSEGRMEGENGCRHERKTRAIGWDENLVRRPAKKRKKKVVKKARRKTRRKK